MCVVGILHNMVRWSNIACLQKSNSNISSGGYAVVEVVELCLVDSEDLSCKGPTWVLPFGGPDSICSYFH